MRNRSRFLRTLGLTSLFMVAGAGISVGQETYNSNGWYKACSDQGENRICNVQYQAVASTGQVIASINVAQISGKLEKRVFQITVPTGRMIPPGMRVVIGEADEKKIPFSFCTQQICAAEEDLVDGIVDQLKSSGSLKIVSVNWRGVENPMSIPLDGFAEAFDGDPIGQDELASRQRKLEEQLKEKSDSLLEKLKKAQEAARAGGDTSSD